MQVLHRGNKCYKFVTKRPLFSNACYGEKKIYNTISMLKSRLKIGQISEDPAKQRKNLDDVKLSSDLSTVSVDTLTLETACATVQPQSRLAVKF